MSKNAIFKALHKQAEPFVLPNAWNAGSARMMEMEGFDAIATTSAGIAFSHGVPDGSLLAQEIVFRELEKIISAVNIPVTADIETGYGDIAKTMAAVQEMGAAGVNIEDADGRTIDDLFDIEQACNAISQARRAAEDDFVINARTDTYLTGQPDALAVSIERGNAYVAAGADCVFIPGACSLDEIATLAKEINAPINILAGVGQRPLTLAQMADCGVKRISTGGSLARHTYAALETALAGIQEGSFDYATKAISDDRMNEMLK